MDVLLWLLVPLAVTSVVALLVCWRARPARPQGPAETAAAYSRFREALGRPVSKRLVSGVTQAPTSPRTVALRRVTYDPDPSAGYRPAGAGRRSRSR